MAQTPAARFSRGWIPHAHRAIVRARGQNLAVRAEREGQDIIVMPKKRRERLPGIRFPQPSLSRVRPGCQQLSVRAERKRINTAFVLHEAAWALVDDRPHPCGSVI